MKSEQNYYKYEIRMPALTEATNSWVNGFTLEFDKLIKQKTQDGIFFQSFKDFPNQVIDIIQKIIVNSPESTEAIKKLSNYMNIYKLKTFESINEYHKQWLEFMDKKL